MIKRTPQALQRRAFRASMWGSLSAVGNIPLALASATVIARILGPRGFGEYALLSFLIPLVVGLSDLGLVNGFLQRAARAYGAHDDPGLRHVAGEAFMWNLVRWPFIYAGIALLVLRNPTAALIYAAVPVGTVITAGSALTLQATVRLVELTRVGFASSAANSLASMVAAIAGGNAQIVFAAGVALQSIVATFQLAWLRDDPAQLRAGLRPKKLGHLREDVRFGFVTFVTGNLIIAMTSRSELLFFRASRSVGRGSYAAGYTVGARIVLPVDAMFGAVGSSLTTVVSDQTLYLRAIERVLRLSGALFSLIAPGLIWFSAVAATLIFPSSFSGVAPAAVTLTASSIFMSSVFPITAIYFSTRRVRPAFVGAMVGLAVNLALSFALVPSYGLVGAVVANAVGTCLYAALVSQSLFASELRETLSHYRRRVVAPVLSALLWELPLAAVGVSWGSAAIGLAFAGAQTYTTARWLPTLVDSDCDAITSALPTPIRPLAGRVLRWASIGPAT